MRIDELLDKGDLDGRAVWVRILKAVKELLSEERPEGASAGSRPSGVTIRLWPPRCWNVIGMRTTKMGADCC